ncbi:ABC transporter ATP-binding protein, partial [Streptomyces sp. SID625]|nr:ABC transporter ATP-binding protein [Streptomyces sp. SID625]
LTRGGTSTTRLVVAHRAATAARADSVAWLDGGRVRAVGPHAELWRHAGYRQVFGGDGAPDGDLGVAEKERSVTEGGSPAGEPGSPAHGAVEAARGRRS